jgi:hypothetical protein
MSILVRKSVTALVMMAPISLATAAGNLGVGSLISSKSGNRTRTSLFS